jgi:HEAT repeat protein
MGKFQRRRSIILLGIGAFCLLGVALFYFRTELLGILRGEPFFQGKPASYWREEINYYIYLRDGKNNKPRPRITFLFWDLPNWFYPAPKKPKPEHEKPAVLFGSPDSIPVLLELLRDPDKEIAIEAGRSLGRFTGNTRVICALQEALNDNRYAVRYCAATGLLRVSPDKKSVDSVRSLGKELSAAADHDKRGAGIDLLAMAAANSPDPVAELIALLRDDGYAPPISQKWLEAQIGKRVGLGMPAGAIEPNGVGDEWDSERYALYCAFTTFGERAVPALVVLLKDRDPRFRSRAARVLGFMGTTSAVPDLTALLRDEDPNVRFQAASALWCIRSSSPATIPELIRILTEDSNEAVRRAALSALVSMQEQPKAVIAALERAAKNDASQTLRKEANEALLRMKATEP